MNAHLTTRSALRTTALAATGLALLLASATACGDDRGSTTASAGHRTGQHLGAAAPTSSDPAEQATGNMWEYMWTDHQRFHSARGGQSSGHDRRQPHAQSGSHRLQHSPGYDKALLREQ